MARDSLDSDYMWSFGIDLEDVKKEYVGNRYGRFDVYDHGTIVIISKDGRESYDTGMKKSEFIKWYGNIEEEER